MAFHTVFRVRKKITKSHKFVQRVDWYILPGCRLRVGRYGIMVIGFILVTRFFSFIGFYFKTIPLLLLIDRIICISGVEGNREDKV